MGMVLNSIMKKYIQKGFTLLELMIVIAMMGVLMVVGIPSFNAMLTTNELADTTNELTLSLRRARAEAIVSGRDVVVCSSTNTDAADPNLITCSGTAGNWSNGWVILVDRDQNGTFGGANELLWVKTLKSTTSLVITTSPATATVGFSGDFSQMVRFSYTGELRDGTAGEFWLCSGAGTTLFPRREIQVTVGGETTFVKNTATNC